MRKPDMLSSLEPGQSFTVEGWKYTVVRTGGGEITFSAAPLPRRKERWWERRRIWADLRRKAKRGKVVG